jgi:hypothetical protein
MAFWLVAAVFVVVLPFALLCSFGTLFAIWALFLPPGEGPFRHSVLLGFLSIAILGLLAGFLVTVAWRLLSYLLGRKEAPYLFHPVVGVVLGVTFGLASTASVGFLLATGSLMAEGRYAPLGPFVFFGFAWVQIRVLRRNRARARVVS